MLINSAAAAELYIAKPYAYTGHGTVPKNVTRVIVNESITVIPADAFAECRYLKEVILPEGLIQIGQRAFQYCASLTDINFPSTLRVIGGCAFWKCSSLVRADFNEGLETIGVRAFGACRSILRLTIPSTMTIIVNWAFIACYALKDVQLCEGVEEIGRQAFYKCYSLLRIDIPSTVTTIGWHAFLGCNFLRNMSIAPDFTHLETPGLEKSHLLHNLRQVGCSLDLAKSRFDNLPLHRICFHQTTGSTATFLDEFKKLATKKRLIKVDCLGMTPLHILACSGRHHDVIEVYKLFVDIYPEALLIKDKWGETPLAYAILGEAPREIIRFLFETINKSNNNHILNHESLTSFDFQTMIETLARKKGTNAEFVRSIIQAQRIHFPKFEIEWERIVKDNVQGSMMHVKVFCVLVEASVSKRLNCMSLKHKLAIDNLTKDMEADERKAVDSWRIIDSIKEYAQQYREFLKEAMTILELALWKFAMDELDSVLGDNNKRNHGGDRVDNVSSESRRQCRLKCNTEDMFPIILSFI